MPDSRTFAYRWRVLAIVVSATLAWASVAAVASAAADKSFSATATPEPLVAGASYGVSPRAAISLLITNTSNQAQLGSANVTVPAGILPTAASPTPGTANVAGQVIELRNLDLQPGEVATVSVSAQVECAANHLSYVWGFTVKQANDFNGTPGNDLAQDAPVVNSVVGNCDIVFAAQPRHAEKTPVAITSAIYDPAGPAVTVAVLDGTSLQTVSWWDGTIALTKGNDPTTGDVAVLTGGLSGSAVNGAVTFTSEHQPERDRLLACCHGDADRRNVLGRDGHDGAPIRPLQHRGRRHDLCREYRLFRDRRPGTEDEGRGRCRQLERSRRRPRHPVDQRSDGHQRLRWLH